MLGIRREAVYTKLEPIPFRALESAFQFARTRGDAYVELAHWLNQILMQPDSDLHRIVSAFGIDHARLAADMSRTLERIRKGGSAMLDFSEHIDRGDRTRLDRRQPRVRGGRIRTGHLILGILEESELTPPARSRSPSSSARSNPSALGRDLARIVEGSPEGEAGTEAVAVVVQRRRGELPPAPMGKMEALNRFTQDLTEQARDGQDRPGARPRRRDPAAGRHPAAPPAEQPDPRRRGRRRQDGGGRGLRRAHRRRATSRRRCKDVSAAHARRRPAAGRRRR